MSCNLLYYCYMELKVFISIFCNRYWVTEMHVDGFRFDLASIMTRGSRLCAKTILPSSIQTGDWCISSFFFYKQFHSFFVNSLWDAVNVYGNSIEGDLLTTGSPLSSPPLVDMISNDPILHGVKVFTVDSLFSPANLNLFSSSLSSLKSLSTSKSSAKMI